MPQPLDLLGGHVGHRAQLFVRGRELCVGRQDLGQPKIRDYRLAVVQEDVAGLQVAVQHPGGVRVPDRRKDLPQELEAGCRGQGTAPLQHRIEGGARDVLHHKKQRLLRLAQGVDVDNAVGIEAGQGLGLLPKAPRECIVVGQMGRNHLQRHGRLEGPIRGAVHRAHAAAANDGVEAVAIQNVTNVGHGGGA